MTRRAVILAAIALLGTSLAAGPQAAYDILITGGRVLDGAGNPWVAANIAIRGDRIARIGRFTAPATRVIDATGLYVAPGFIDMMDQSGSALRRDGTAQSKVRQGVTTLIAGEGGTPVAPADLEQYFATLETQGISVNFGTFVSAAQARTAVLQSANRDPSPEELERMQAIVEAGMQHGALGLTTALIYPPESYAKTPELVALAKVSARYGGIYASHVRDEGLGELDAIGEAIEIGEKAGLPVEIFHLKVAHRAGWRTLLPRIDALVQSARARGVDVTADQYPYTASGTGLDSCIPAWAAEGGAAERNTRLQDPITRARIRDEMKHGSPGWFNRVQAVGTWKNVVIASMPPSADQHYVGMTIEDIARERRQPPEDTVMDLVSQSTAGIGALYFMMSEDDVRTAMTYPWVSVGSDAAAGSIETAQGRGHPRQFGTFPRIIARYVREARVLTLENAVRRMTSLPAGKLHLSGRGTLVEGGFADITLFDYERIEDTATYESPHRYPKGIPYVLVNGQVVVDKGEHTGARPGRVIYGAGRKVASRESRVVGGRKQTVCGRPGPIAP
jgi:N-acyl-D-aspartate/D-glutamate deacylase